MQLSPDRILAMKGAASALIRALVKGARARDLTHQRPFLSQCEAIYAASPPQVHVARSLGHHHKASQPRSLRCRTLSSWIPRSADRSTRGSLTPGNSRLCGPQCGYSRRSKNEKRSKDSGMSGTHNARKRTKLNTGHTDLKSLERIYSDRVGMTSTLRPRD